MRILLIALLSIVVLSSCKENEPSGGEPDTYSEYFTVVDATNGKDLFINNTSYNPDSLVYYVEDVNQTIILVGNPLYTVTDSAVIFGPIGLHEFNLLQFNESNIDTVETVKKFDECGSECLRGELFQYYYNGNLIQEYNFEENPGLWNTFTRRNSDVALSTETAPMILVFEKEANNLD
jgi:hypothetical protein